MRKSLWQTVLCRRANTLAELFLFVAHKQQLFESGRLKHAAHAGGEEMVLNLQFPLKPAEMRHGYRLES